MIAVIDYKAGNVRSVENALNRLGVCSCTTADAKTIRQADKVILPGVGHAFSAMASLKEENLDRLIPRLAQPVLGICLGLQLLCQYTEEGETKGLGIFDTIVRHFPSEGIVPHMGWNNLQRTKGALFSTENKADDFYFVHSFYAEKCAHTSAECDYILPFSAALQKNNFYATQFHPEKSGAVGAQLLKNFLAL